MATAAARARRNGTQVRAALRARLEARREEIEAAALTRVRAISDSGEVSDPAYAEGLRAAVAAAVEYGIETTGRDGPNPPIPIALLAQARMAARVGIPLDTVLRRYFAGYSLLGYFVLEEASHAGLSDGDELKRLLGAHAGTFDRLLATVGEEHGREREAVRTSTERRRAEQVECLLAGEMIDTDQISYDFEGWHLGLLAAGPGAEQRVRELASASNCCLLCVPRDGGTVWAWLGARRRLDPADLLRTPGLQDGSTGDIVDADIALALGEPGEGLAGWRLTHRQATAALPVAQRGPEPAVRYAEVALLAMALQDDLLATSLRQLYLEPLERGRDDGLSLRRTLRAYLDCERNSASTAAALGVTRQTVNSRLRVIAERIGRPLASCTGELEVSLRLSLDEVAFRRKATSAHD